MPELPDVQVFKEYVDATALHQRIDAVELDLDGLRRHASARELRSTLVRHELRSTRRHGKHLFVDVTADGWLTLHFGMTGSLDYGKADGDRPDHVRLEISFSNGDRLLFLDPRKLGRVEVVDDVDRFLKSENLGPDALDLDLAGLRSILGRRSGSIKGTLMNQEAIAGIGNVYADDVLLEAGIDPRSRTDRLDRDASRRLHRAIGKTLRRAIRARADPSRLPASFLLPHREKGGKCPRCGEALERIEVSGRTTYLCPREQERIR